jgi:hypothetical protein
MSRAGVGKTAFMVDIAIDHLMHERKVLHVHLDDPVEKVREFYDEIFHDLADSMKLENRDRVHLTVERHRLIQTFGRDIFNMEKVRHGIALAHDHMHFDPEVVILDGYPSFSQVTEEQIRELKELAQSFGCELWIAARARREDPTDERGIPTKVARFEEYLSVIVKLEPAGDHVRLNLLKDHDNPNVADLFLELDPRTLLLKWR